MENVAKRSTPAMNNEILCFDNAEFGSVRTAEINGKVYFCGTDVAKALGYTVPHKAIREHCRYGLKQTVPHPQSPDKVIEMSFIPEGDIYRLVAHSKLPTAEKFEQWVFDDVLPSIRKHGLYATDELLSDPDFAIAAFTALKEEREKNKALTEQVFAQNRQIDTQTQQIAELEPKGIYYDIILQTENTMTTTQIAKDYGFSAQLFNKILHELEIVYPQNGSWVLYQQYANSGFGKTNTYTYWKGDGENSSLSLVWTQTGRLFLYERLKSHGILPVVETEYSDANFSNPIVVKCQGKNSENHAKFRGIPHDLMEEAYKAYKEKTSPLKNIVKSLGISLTTFYKKADKYERFPDLRVY